MCHSVRGGGLEAANLRHREERWRIGSLSQRRRDRELSRAKRLVAYFVLIIKIEINGGLAPYMEKVL